jgi:bifunctional non-homologous end joining protein LigD
MIRMPKTLSKRSLMSSKGIQIDGHKIELSHLDKVLFPKSGITKEELVTYYHTISSMVLPLYENRPLTMQRCPDGIDKQNFIQKGVPDYFPPWIDRFELSKDKGTIEQVLVNNAATLVYLANQACITFHLGLSQVDKIHYPSYLIFDLDPSTEDIVLLKNVVKYVKELIDQLELKGFIKTTGSRGFHIYIPLKREHTFEEVHDFAKLFATYLTKKYPQEITIEQSKAKREKRVLIDYARNSYGLSAVAPYSIRAIERAPIATPLDWEDLKEKDLNSQSYNIRNIYDRLKVKKDPWREMGTHLFSLESPQLKLVKLLDMS